VTEATSTTTRSPINVALTGGGTAGHVWPHFALVDDDSSRLGKMARENGVRFFYFGSHGGMERDIVAQNAPEWIYIAISTGKLRRYFSWRNFVDPLFVLLGVLKALVMLARIRANVVFSKGGFVSAPVVWAAWLLRIPVVIHESDLSPALATRLTLPFANRALCTFEETKALCSARYRNKVLPLGLPLRRSLFAGNREDAVKFFEIDSSRKTLLVFGGSLGAEPINRAFVPSVETLAKSYNVIHIVGRGKKVSAGSFDNYRQYEFLNREMALAYAIADLCICRAGASSIFELATARIPMILIPLGLAQSRGDQIENAKSFARKGWAEILWEKDLTTDLIVSVVDGAMGSLEERKKALANAPGLDAAAQVGELLLSLASVK
jgi:UDP-N-acetylglucosamine--N-acetylmuramyl-(pentapeptide) pyrophosphoryl-undecaprenol N-acetylglucosamine transferase